MISFDFDKVRPLFGGKLTQGQVDGINVTLRMWEREGDGDVNKLAYVLATKKHETAHTMQPVKETYSAKFDGDSQPEDGTVIRRLDDAYAKGRLGSVKTLYWRTGWFGRGDVQLTHEANYKGKARAAVLKRFGVDIHADRDKVLDPEISAFIQIRGMLEGWFTTKKLSTYINAKSVDFKNARRTVNGLDRADDIAKIAIAFREALDGTAVLPPLAPRPNFFERLFGRQKEAASSIKDELESAAQRFKDLFPQQEGRPMRNWLNTFVTTTAFKYVVTMVAQFLAVKLGLEEGEITGIILQIVAVAMGIWGMAESAKSKIVVNGVKHNIPNDATVSEAKAIAANTIEKAEGQK